MGINKDRSEKQLVEDKGSFINIQTRPKGPKGAIIKEVGIYKCNVLI